MASISGTKSCSGRLTSFSVACALSASSGCSKLYLARTNDDSAVSIWPIQSMSSLLTNASGELSAVSIAPTIDGSRKAKNAAATASRSLMFLVLSLVTSGVSVLRCCSIDLLFAVASASRPDA